MLSQVILYLEDYQMVDSSFLQITSDLLCGGISGLYSNDELQVNLAF